MECKARHILLQDSVWDWLENFKKNSVKPSTFDRLKISFSLLRKYPIAHMDLGDIRCRDVQNYINQVVEDGYSMSTVKKQYTMLTDYFKHAYSLGDIPTPVYIGTFLPSSENIKKPVKTLEVYSEDEQHRLIEVLTKLDHISYGIALLMLECGLRIGEAQALTWNDISWSRRSVTIRKTFVKLSMSGGYSFVQQSAKSKSSMRTIPLSKRAIETLKKLSTFGDKNGLIFPSEEDPHLPISYATVRYYLRIACQKADVEYRGNHIFRHTFATNCYYKGCNVKLLSRLLGHSDVAITYNTYIHLFGDALEEMRSIID